MNYTKAKVYFPSGTIKYTVGTTYNHDKTCSGITTDFDTGTPVLIIWYNEGTVTEEFFNITFSVELDSTKL